MDNVFALRHKKSRILARVCPAFGTYEVTIRENYSKDILLLMSRENVEKIANNFETRIDDNLYRNVFHVGDLEPIEMESIHGGSDTFILAPIDETKIIAEFERLGKNIRVTVNAGIYRIYSDDENKHGPCSAEDVMRALAHYAHDEFVKEN